MINVSQNRIGIIGREGEILPYIAAGAIVEVAETEEEAVNKFRVLRKRCFLIFTSDDFLRSIFDEYTKISDIPNVISAFPGTSGISDNSKRTLQEAVSKAIGFNLREGADE